MRSGFAAMRSGCIAMKAGFVATRSGFIPMKAGFVRINPAIALQVPKDRTEGSALMLINAE